MQYTTPANDVKHLPTLVEIGEKNGGTHYLQSHRNGQENGTRFCVDSLTLLPLLNQVKCSLVCVRPYVGNLWVEI